MRLSRILPVVFASLLASVAGAVTCVERLPAGASLVGSADFAKIRTSKVVDRAAWEAARGPEMLERAGIRFRSDVDELAVAMLPAASPDKPTDFVAIMAGRFDHAKVKSALVAQGGKAEQLGSVPVVRMPAGGALELHPSLPSLQGPGSLLVSFLGDMLVIGTERGTRGAHGPKQGLPSAALAAARQSVPTSAALWLSADLPAQPADSGPMALAGGLQRVTLWALFGDALEVKALGKAADAQRATQLAGLATMLVGAATMQPELKPLAGLRVVAEADTLSASVRLSPAEIQAMTGGL